MNVFLCYDLCDTILSFITIDDMIHWKNTSKANRNLFKRFLKKKYNTTLKQINKRRCLSCFAFDRSSVQTRYCLVCVDRQVNRCEDCYTCSKKELKCVPASCYLIGSYEISYVKYICFDGCKYICVACHASSSDYRLFRKSDQDDQIYCTLCILSCSEEHTFSDAYKWYGLTPEQYKLEFPALEPYEDYDDDRVFADDIFMFSFYVYSLFQ